jgi:hypothetical protein
VKAGEGPAGAAQDFADLHAWCEVYLPGAGWIGLDPTSGLLAGEGHLPLACSPEPSSAAPISGAVEKCESTFEYAMTVRRILETPRVTLPYAEEAWAAIDAVGGSRSTRFSKGGDVRLTVGGEPTFVADGRHGRARSGTRRARAQRKRELAGMLFHRVFAEFGKGGFIHYGQGKMVSRRAAAPLGARVLLAQGQEARSGATPAPGRPRSPGTRRGGRPPLRGGARGAPRPEGGAPRPGLRGRPLPCVEGAADTRRLRSRRRRA